MNELRNPLLQRFLQEEDNRRLYQQVVSEEREEDRRELERRFAEHYFEMRFLGYVRKHIHYEALHLLRKSRDRRRIESLLLNADAYGDEGGVERLEQVEDESVRLEEQVVERTEELADLTGHGPLHRALFELTVKQRLVLDLLYVRQMTEQEAGDRLGVSQQAVNKIKRQSLHRLRKRLVKQPSRKQVKV
ncbi:MAG TPA: sigma-70 family RNA polymerase sigma factor [Bacilli bacterium]|nr:sigma-70 family RNA polymerase sigma factor [Bacilli bacterium]